MSGNKDLFTGFLRGSASSKTCSGKLVAVDTTELVEPDQESSGLIRGFIRSNFRRSSDSGDSAAFRKTSARIREKCGEVPFHLKAEFTLPDRDTRITPDRGLRLL